MGKVTKFPPEVRELSAIRLVSEQEGQYGSQWAAIKSVSGKIGCTAETLRSWIRQSERDAGKREGLTTTERERLKQLEKENKELKRPNEILRLASAYFPRRSSTAHRDDCRLYRRASRSRGSRVGADDKLPFSPKGTCRFPVSVSRSQRPRRVAFPSSCRSRPEIPRGKTIANWFLAPIGPCSLITGQAHPSRRCGHSRPAPPSWTGRCRKMAQPASQRGGDGIWRS